MEDIEHQNQALRERVRELQRELAARRLEIEVELAKFTPSERAALAQWPTKRDPKRPLS